MMDVKVSEKPKFRRGDDRTMHVKWLTSCEKITLNSNVKKPVSCEDFELKDVDDDDAPRFSMISSLGKSNSKFDGSVKKRPATTLPDMRLFDNRNFLHGLIKRSKVSAYDDHEKDEGDIPMSNIDKVLGKSVEKSFSLLKEELELLEKSFDESKRKKKVEEKRLQFIKRDIEECCKELGNKKSQVSCVRRINECHKKMQGKIEECVKDFVGKEAQLYLMEDLIEERKQELKVKVVDNILKQIELCEVVDNIDKERGRKEEELNVLSRKIVECGLELKAKEEELDTMNKFIGVQAENLESERKKLLKVISVKKCSLAQMKEFESMKERFEGRVKELELKEKQCERRVEELVSKEKNLEGRLKELESREKQLRAMELESKEMQLEGRVKVFESKEQKYEGEVKDLEFKQKHFENQFKEFESNESQHVGRVNEFESKKKEFECQITELVKELVSKQKHLESRTKELDSKWKQHEGRVKEHESKVRAFEGQMNEFQSKKKEFEGKLKDIKSKEEELEGQVKELESKKKYFERQVEDFKFKEKQFEGRWKELESKNNKFKEKMKVLRL